MPFIEVDDAIAAAMAKEGLQFKDASAHIKKGQEFEAAWSKMLASDQRDSVLAAYKKVFPDAVLPTDFTAPVKDEVAALKKEFDEYRESVKKAEDDRRENRRKESAERTVADGRKWLRTEKKLDDEGEKAVEQIMQDKGIADYEVAYHHWKAQQPPEATPLPSAYGGARSLDWFKAEESRPDTKLLLSDPRAFQRNETGKVLQEIREGKLAA